MTNEESLRIQNEYLSEQNGLFHRRVDALANEVCDLRQHLIGLLFSIKGMNDRGVLLSIPGLTGLYSIKEAAPSQLPNYVSACEYMKVSDEGRNAFGEKVRG